MTKSLKSAVDTAKSLKSRAALNEEAISNMVNEGNHIFFDMEHPLIINDKAKIVEIFVLEDEDYDDEIEERECLTSSLELMKKIRIVFQDEAKKYIKERDFDKDKYPYSIDIFTIYSLEKVVDFIKVYEDEVEFEDLI